MLYEDEVIQAVREYLAAHGYVIEQALSTTQHGDDIIALSPCRKFRVYVEAKGETSSDKKSKRYNKPFSRSQVRDHVANAFYRAAQMLQNKSDIGVKVGIALPKNDLHLRAVERVAKALEQLHIEVFWVTQTGNAEVLGHWADAK